MTASAAHPWSPGVVGYLSTVSAAPGDEVDVHAYLVDPPARPVGFTLRVQRFDSAMTRSLPRVTAAALTDERRSPGSFGIASVPGEPAELTVLCWARWRRAPAEEQTIVSLHPAGASPADSGSTGVRVAAAGVRVVGAGARTGYVPARPEAWHLLAMDVARSRLTLSVVDLGRGTVHSASTPRTEARRQRFGALSAGADAATVTGAQHHFDGRASAIAVLPAPIDLRRLAQLGGRPLSSGLADIPCLAAWDYAHCADLRRRVDVDGSTYRIESVLGAATAPMVMVNAPTDGLHGHVGGSRSVEFCSTDLDDADAALVGVVTVDPREPPGVLGVEVVAGGSRTTLPLIVRPAASPTGRRQRRALFLFPSFTYQAYANHRQASEATYFGDYSDVADRPVTIDAMNAYLNQASDLGNSLYDRRPDGSAAVYSSMRRPVLNLAPDYRWWLTGAARHFPADLAFWRWLQATGLPIDAATDHDLHRDADLLDGYSLLVTGSHPEYVTRSMLDSIDAFVRTGGDLAYLGGNGFYWRAETHPSAPHRLEVRRFGEDGWWNQASREEARLTTAAEPGDAAGGLWAHLGRPPEDLVGIAYVAQGWGRAAPYRRLGGADSPSARFIFEGIPRDALIGDFGDALGGAAGDEIDWVPPTRPRRRFLVVGTSEGLHPDLFEVSARFAGTMAHREARSDMVFAPREHGAGAVFAAGSICWSASVTATSTSPNYAAILTRNVIEGLLADHS